MRVYVNLDSSEFVTSPTLLQRVSMHYFVRRDTVPVEVQFVRGGSVVELASGATGQLGIKKTYTGSFLANDAGWTQTGTGSSTVYQFDLALNTTELSAEFDPDATTDSITAKFEISWTVAGTTSSTMPCECTIYNDVIRGSEGSVSFANTMNQFDLRASDNSIWRVTIDASGILTTQKV